MENWLLIAVLFYLVLSIGNGYRKGLVKMIVSVAALFVTIMVSRIAAPQVEEYLRQKTMICEQIQEKTEEYVDSILGEKLQNGLFSVSDQAYAIEQLPLPKYIRTALTKNNIETVYHALGVSAFEDYISRILTEVAIRAIAFVLSFLVVGVGVLMVSKLIEGIFKLPGLNWMNRMGGALAGGIKALVILWILCLSLIHI